MSASAVESDGSLQDAYRAVEARSSGWSRWMYRVSQATASTFGVLGALMGAVKPFDRYVASESIAGSTLSGFGFFVNSWSIHVGVLDWKLAARLEDSGGKVQAVSKMSGGSLGIVGSLFPMFCTIARQVNWFIPVAVGAGLGFASFGCFAAASFLHMVFSAYNTWQCHQLRVLIRDSPETALAQWKTLLQESDPIAMERGLEECKRSFGIEGVELLVDYQEVIIQAESADSREMQELFTGLQKTLFRNELLYVANTVVAALGLAILILCVIFSGGFFPVVLAAVGAVLGAFVGIVSRQIPLHLASREPVMLEMTPTSKK